MDTIRTQYMLILPCIAMRSDLWRSLSSGFSLHLVFEQSGDRVCVSTSVSLALLNRKVYLKTVDVRMLW